MEWNGLEFLKLSWFFVRGNLRILVTSIKSIKIAPSLPEASFKRATAGSFELDISLLELLTGQG